MKNQTRDTMIGITLGLNAILGVALFYDYAANDSRLTAWVLGAYVAFSVVFLLMWALTRRQEAAADAIAQYLLERGEAPPRPALPAAASAPAAPEPIVAAPAPVAKPAAEPFTYDGYTLHAREVELKNGGRRTIYFFSRQRPASGSPAPKPEGFHVGVNRRTGLPFLKKGDGRDGEDLTPHPEPALRPQCAALTEAGHQCRNSSRHGSLYCSSHFGYQPPPISKAAAAREDTTPRVRAAPDTAPRVRRAS
jgi:hypothetical protein